MAICPYGKASLWDYRYFPFQFAGSRRASILLTGEGYPNGVLDRDPCYRTANRAAQIVAPKSKGVSQFNDQGKNKQTYCSLRYAAQNIVHLSLHSSVEMMPFST